MNSLNELFEDTVKDIYSGEKQALKGMQKMLKKTTDAKLKQTIETHIRETEEQIKQVEEVARMGGFKPSGKVCAGMKGVVEEADEHLKEFEKGPVLDAAIIACAQKVEHYEIANYGTARTWAEQLGMADCARILETILKQEETADELLNQCALGGVNEQAARSDGSAKASGAAKRIGGSRAKTGSTASKGAAKPGGRAKML